VSLSELLSGDRPPREYQPPQTPWTVYIGFGLLVLAVVGAVLFAMAPSPYVVERPGPAFDTLGEVTNSDGDEVALIDIPDETTYPTSGELNLLTVYVDGSRERPLAWLEVAGSWFDPSRTILPIDVVYPDGQTDEEADAQSAAAMSSSQQDSVAAALTELGIDFDSVMVISGVIDGTPAEGVLEVGDEVLAADGIAIENVEELRAVIVDAGIGANVVLEIVRDGAELDVNVVPVAGSEGSPVIGVYGGARYEEFPIEVNIQLENVGGPSAGMMFALGIYDKLTPGELTGGENIAGTGTIVGSGEVGAIGGVIQKMYAARDAGADWFLSPVANCDDVVGNIPSGIEVFAVSTLDEAIAAVESIADGDTSQLARCD
jgi:PDZ domain-containing protein